MVNLEGYLRILLLWSSCTIPSETMHSYMLVHDHHLQIDPVVACFFYLWPEAPMRAKSCR